MKETKIIPLKLEHIKEIKECPKCHHKIGWIKRWLGLSIFKRTWIKKELGFLSQYVKCKNEECDFETSYRIEI